MERSQLMMVRKSLEDLPQLLLPHGYDIRFHQDGDEQRLTPVFRQCFDPGWNPDRILKTFVEDPVWSPNRMCVLCHGEEVVGTATAWECPERRGHGGLHYLAVLPKHRQKGLGTALVVRVLQLLKDMGYPDVWLATDDFRLPAIRTYLSLGFEPVCQDKSHEERWEIVRHKLRAASAD